MKIPFPLLAPALLTCCATTTPTNTSTRTVTPSVSTSGVKSYPLKTCIVTDNDLESMGGSIRLVHEGQEVKFCCQPCIGKFRTDPGKYLRKLG